MYSVNVMRECKEKMLCANVRILCTVQRHNNARMFSRMFMIYDGNIDVGFMTHSRRTMYAVHCTLVLQFTRRTLYVHCTWITWKVIVTKQRTLCTEQ